MPEPPRRPKNSFLSWPVMFSAGTPGPGELCATWIWVLLSSLLFYEDLGPQFSREGADSEEKAVTWDTGTTRMQQLPFYSHLPSTPTRTPGTHSGEHLIFL